MADWIVVAAGWTKLLVYLNEFSGVCEDTNRHENVAF